MTENSRLRVANSGPRAFAPDFATNAANGRFLRCVTNPDPTKPLDVQWQDVVPLTNLSAGLIIDVGTTVPPATQDGNTESPYATLAQAAARLLTMTATNGFSIGAVAGDYSVEPAVVIDPLVGTGVFIGPHPAGSSQFAEPLVLPQITFLLNTLLIQGAFCTAPITAGAVVLIGCNMAAGQAVTSTTNLTLEDSVVRNVVAGGAGSALNAERTTFDGTLNFGGSIVNLVDSRFVVATAVTFTAAAGVLTMDGATYASFLRSGSSVVNGTVDVVNSLLRARISVAVPAIVAAGLDYVDVSTVGTALAGIIADTPITANPTADLAAAGAGNGGFINARVSALNTIRCAFVGILVGGAVDFVFATAG